mmetsp:Transcript_27471/g.50712  ORF Transcript_27471/g.50712 Transcript_27471/m.50712 type:complete len:238 (+) Transcript_27471:2451-3164(+)
MQVQEHLKMRFRVAPRLECLPGDAGRFTPFGQPVMGQMIVKDDIFHAPACHMTRQAVVEVQKMRLKPQLWAQIGHKVRSNLGHGGKHLIGKFIAAQSALPADELRQNACGNPVGRQLRLGCAQPLAHLLHRAAPGGQMPLEPVAMDIDDARQDAIPCQIDAAPRRVRDDHALCNGQGRVREAVRVQHVRTHDINREHRGVPPGNSPHQGTQADPAPHPPSAGRDQTTQCAGMRAPAR